MNSEVAALGAAIENGDPEQIAAWWLKIKRQTHWGNYEHRHQYHHYFRELFRFPAPFQTSIDLGLTFDTETRSVRWLLMNNDGGGTQYPIGEAQSLRWGVALKLLKQGNTPVPPQLASEGAFSAAQLSAKYNDLGHPFYKRSDWKTAINEERTLLGYWEWVFGLIEAEGA